MHQYTTQRYLALCILANSLLIPADYAWAAGETRYEFENEHVRLRLSTRTPQQMSGFYEGRGFPKNVIAETRNACFITVGLRNKSRDIVWLDLGKWSFHADSTEIRRIHRDDWKQRWHTMAVPLRIQSTFRWTLLPENLDLRPDEGEGGKITIPRNDKPFSLHIVFDTGKDRKGQPIEISTTPLVCPES